MNYYNENDPKAAAWLRELIKGGHIAPGEVDERSIADVKPGELIGFPQCHFFAGIGGWSYALRLAGWPDDRLVWTGSCPCQPFSVAGKRAGTADKRHLWPDFARLIAQCNPAIVFGEQVASKDGRIWLSGVRADLEEMGYAVGAADLCAGSVGAPHVRQRLWWVAHSAMYGCEGLQQRVETQVPQDRPSKALGTWNGTGNTFENWREFLAQSDVFRVDDGVSSLVDIRPRLHAYGNAIVPQVAAEFIRACQSCI